MNGAKTVRTFRELHGVPQHELARRIYVTQPLISRIERGLCKCSVEMMDDILHALGYKLAIVKLKEEKSYESANNTNRLARSADVRTDRDDGDTERQRTV